MTTTTMELVKGAAENKVTAGSRQALIEEVMAKKKGRRTKSFKFKTKLYLKNKFAL